MNGATIIDRLHFYALNKPSRTALRFLDDQARVVKSVTWGELWKQATLVAHNLRERGMAGRRVVLLLPTGVEFVAGLFGIFLAKGVAVPLKPSRPTDVADRLTTILEDVDPSAVLIDGVVGDRYSTSLAGQTCIRFEDLLTAANYMPPLDTFGTDVAIIQYTSGSTSVPKGVEVTHNNILSNAQAICQAMRINESSVGVSWLPLFHDMGLMGSLMTAIYKGCELNLFNPTSFVRRPLSWLAAIKAFSATHAPAPNFAFDYCCEKISDDDIKDLDLSSLQMFLSGAEAVRPSTMLRFVEKFGPAGMTTAKIAASYGLAEATLYVSGAGADGLEFVNVDLDRLSVTGQVCAPNGQGRTIAIASVGAPQPDTKIKIVDPKTGCLLQDDHTGEIWVSGTSVANGYFRKPVATEKVFRNRLAGEDEAAFLRTGDIGFIRDGRLFVTGRLSDLIVVRGVNHHPEDIEASIRDAHSSLRTHACAAFVADPEAGQLIIVQEVPRKLIGDASTLFPVLADAISRQHGIRPADIILVRLGSLPTTSSGKIRRSAARDLYSRSLLAVVDTMASRVSQSSSPRLPMTPAERTVYRVWTEVLENDDIGPEDSFFSIGGTSLEVVQVHSRLVAEYPDLEIEKLFEHPTIRTLAAYLEGVKKFDRVASAQIRGGRRRDVRRSKSHVN